MAELFKLPEHLIIKPDKSVERLSELKFDPIQRLTMLYDKITIDLYNMMYDTEGNMRPKFSQVAYAALLGIQAKIANDLIRFGYKRVPEVIDINQQTNVTPFSITLNGINKEE